MADLSDVSNAIGAIIGTALYPSTPTGEASSPIAGLPVRVEVGWPSPQSLDEAIAAGKAHISIYPRPSERNTTRFSQDWEELSQDDATYALGVAGQAVTVTGAAPNPARVQNIALFLNGAAYTIQTTAGQTASQVATALRAAIVADHAATVAGAVVTIPAGVRIGAARVQATGTIGRELRRQEREFQIIVWAPSPAARDAVTQPVDLALAKLERIDLPDGYSARLTYKSTMLTDFDQKAGIFRRDLFYSVEYPTTESDDATAISVVEANVADFFDNPIVSIDA